MTAENQLGEILEVPAEAGSESARDRKRSRRASAQEHCLAATTLSATLASASTISEQRAAPAARTPNPASVSGWRASSYDLLHGLVVRDVSEKIPHRMFEALFSSDAAAMPPSSRRKR